MWQEPCTTIRICQVSCCLGHHPGGLWVDIPYRNHLPHFLRWIKLSASDDPNFTAAIVARDVLYNLLGLKAKDIHPLRSFHLGTVECFHPSTEMLTSVNVNPNAPVVDIPPFYDTQALEASIHQGHGEYSFTANNEVLYFTDKTGGDRCDVSNDLLSSRCADTSHQPSHAQ